MKTKYSITLEPKARGFRIHGRRETFATPKAAARWLERKLWLGRVRVVVDGPRLVGYYNAFDTHLDYAVRNLATREQSKAIRLGCAYRRLPASGPLSAFLASRRAHVWVIFAPASNNPDAL